MHPFRTLLVGIALAFAGKVSFGQTEPAAPGSYHLMTTEPKRREVFTTELLVLIEAQRNEHTDKLLRVGEVSWVWIPSEDHLNAADYQPYPEGVEVVTQAYLESLLQRAE